MNAKGVRRHSPRSKLIALAIVAIAVAVGLYAQHRSTIHPSTDDASIEADIVHVAPVVGGRIIEIAVEENARVSRGDLLF
jgi:multidrug efflux system membrane fusion protein